MDPDNWESVETLESRSGVMVSNLPLLFAHGLPSSLSTMTVKELETFVPFMVRCSLGEDLTTSWAQLPRPLWWPSRLPFRIPSSQTINTRILVRLIERCYNFHGCQYLLQFCSSLQQIQPSVGYRFTDNRDGTTSMYRGGTGKLLVTFRNENRDYDKASLHQLNLHSPKKLLLPSSQISQQRKQKQQAATPTKRGGGVMVQPPITDVFLCDKCDDEFATLSEVQRHEKHCKGNERNEPLPPPSPEPPDEECVTQDQVPFLSYLQLCPAAHTGVASYESPRKRSAPKSASYHSYMQFDTVDIASPLGKSILSKAKYGGRLPAPQQQVLRYERHIHATPECEYDTYGQSRDRRNRWMVVYRPPRKELWAHLYCFTSADRREREKTIAAANRCGALLNSDTRVPIVNLNTDASVGNLIDNCKYNVKDLSSVKQDYEEKIEDLDILCGITNGVKKHLHYLNTLMTSKIYKNKTHEASIKDSYDQSTEMFDAECGTYSGPQSIRGLGSTPLIRKKRRRRPEVQHLLSDECRELQRRGISRLHHLARGDPQQCKVTTRCSAEKAMRSCRTYKRNRDMPKMLLIDACKKAKVAVARVPEVPATLESVDTSSLSPRMFDTLTGHTFGDDSSYSNFDLTSDANMNYKHTVNQMQQLMSDSGEIICVTSKKENSSRHSLKYHKLPRELQNLAQDECKELKDLGFHPSDIVDPWRMPQPDLDDDALIPPKYQRRPSLISFKRNSTENKLNSLSSPADAAFAIDASNRRQTKELARLMADEWKELRLVGAHPSQIRGLLSLQRNVRSNGLAAVAAAESAARRHSPNNPVRGVAAFMGRTLRAQEKASLTPVLRDLRRSHRDMIRSENGMCIFTYRLQDDTLPSRPNSDT